MQSRNPKWTIAVAAFAAFLATFNETFLNIGFSPIMSDLRVSVSTVQWLATAYMLGAAVMVPVSSFAYRSISTRKLFLSSVGLLIAGSLIGALAQNFQILLAGRIVQALGTGLLIPVGMNITLEVAPKEKLGVYMGLMGAMTTLGPSLSIILAGSLLAFFSWHMLLWVFAALSLLLFLCGVFFLGNIAKLTHPKLDAASVALIGLGLVGLLYGISTSFSGPIWMALAAAVGAGFLYGFIRRQRRLREPLINLKPLASKPFAIGILINMISLLVIFAMNIVLPIFIQGTIGASSFSASLALFPAILLSCVIAPIAGKIYDSRGARLLLPLGFALICAFTAALAFSAHTESLVLLTLVYIPVICGSALIIGPVQGFALSFLKPELRPDGVVVMSTGFQIAGCIGSSLFTGAYFAVMSTRMGRSINAHAASNEAFMVTALLAGVCALVGFFLAIHVTKNRPEVADRGQGFSVRSIMKADVYSVGTDFTLFEALKVITEKKVSGVPVLDEAGNIAGFISDGDILRYLAKNHPLFVNAHSLAAINAGEQGLDAKLHNLIRLRVADIAQKHVITVNSDDDLGEICRILSERNIKKAPVMERGCMIGMINASNITKFAMKACQAGMDVAQ